MFRPRSGWHYRVDGDLDFLVITPLHNLPTLPTEREFYAVVMESGVSRPYGVAVASVYFFHEFRSVVKTRIVRSQQWLAKVDKAITMRIRTRAESMERENQADDDFLGDITPEITGAVLTNQSPSEKGAQLPTRKRRRIDPREQSGTKSVEHKKRLEAFVAAKEERSKTLLALINEAATPQTRQAMNNIFEHSFGTEHTRATAAFAQALQKVTTAMGTARKERASTLQEIADQVDELRDEE